MNIASKWGLTDKNYKQLVQIHKEHKDTLQILGFPCNQFWDQEPGTPEEIIAFARGKYGAEFPIFEKINVNGDDCHDVYQYLRQHVDGAKIPWSWSKFTVDRNGKVLQFYEPTVDPEIILIDMLREAKLWEDK